MSEPEQSDDIELEMLRDFYDCWLEFHRIAKTNLPRSTLERAAQRMTDAHIVVRNYRHPVIVGHG